MHPQSHFFARPGKTVYMGRDGLMRTSRGRHAGKNPLIGIVTKVLPANMISVRIVTPTKSK